MGVTITISFRLLIKTSLAAKAVKNTHITSTLLNGLHIIDDDPDEIGYSIFNNRYKAADASARTRSTFITGHQYSEVIIGGSGDDTLRPHGSFVGGYATQLYGGAGKDVFYHTNANFLEVITDYEASKDQLRFIEGLATISG